MTPIQLLISASPDAQRFMQAAGAALTPEQQLFVSANLPQLAAWLQTDIGRLAFQTFVNDWQQSAGK